MRWTNLPDFLVVFIFSGMPLPQTQVFKGFANAGAYVSLVFNIFSFSEAWFPQNLPPANAG